RIQAEIDESRARARALVNGMEIVLAAIVERQRANGIELAPNRNVVAPVLSEQEQAAALAAMREAIGGGPLPPANEGNAFALAMIRRLDGPPPNDNNQDANEDEG
ncbi:hypothetical protein PFISCL1PPCAC_11777, partial [Pristionchus fissidentatus]